MNKIELKPCDEVEFTVKCMVDEVTYDARGGYFIRLKVHETENNLLNPLNYIDVDMNTLNYIDVDMNTLNGSIRKLEYDPFVGKLK